MPLEQISEMMLHARQHGYAVGYFESWDIASLQGVIDAAETVRSPVIIGFSGEFLSRVDRLTEERLAWYGALGKAAADSASVPCGFIFNECPRDEWVHQAVTAGFNLVMPVDPEAPLENYMGRVAELTQHAHQHRVAVEAEIGVLPFGGTGEVQPGGSQTDPTAAAQFVAETGIDLLAVSVGNVHILIRGHQTLDLEHLSKIREKVSIPLVLHGGTGIEESTLREAVGLGVAKVNYGTIIKQRFLAAVRKSLGSNNENPHHLLGYGGDDDLLVAGRLAVRDVVLDKMEILGSKKRA